MKRLVAAILVLTMLLTGCAEGVGPEANSAESASTVQTETGTDAQANADTVQAPEQVFLPDAQFTGLDDPALLDWTQRSLCARLDARFQGSGYTLVDASVSYAPYVSQEYMEETAFNSQSNIYFGYTLSELDSLFLGQRYVFTLGTDGRTVPQAVDNWEDDTLRTVLGNIALGSGMVLICVVVSVASMSAGNRNISLIFATSAKDVLAYTQNCLELSDMIPVLTSAVTGEPAELEERAAALQISERFKWAALGGMSDASNRLLQQLLATQWKISPAIVESLLERTGLPVWFLQQLSTYEQFQQLEAALPPEGMTLTEMAEVCQSTGYPLELVRLMGSVEEAAFYQERGLVYLRLEGVPCLLQPLETDLETVLDEKNMTNLERMALGVAPISATDDAPYALHLLGWSEDNPLVAVMSRTNHIQLHDQDIDVCNQLSGSETADGFWKGLAKAYH